MVKINLRKIRDVLPANRKNAELSAEILSLRETLAQTLKDFEKFREDAEATIGFKEQELDVLNEKLDALRAQIEQTKVEEEQEERVVAQLVHEPKQIRLIAKIIFERIPPIAMRLRSFCDNSKGGFLRDSQESLTYWIKQQTYGYEQSFDFERIVIGYKTVFMHLSALLKAAGELEKLCDTEIDLTTEHKKNLEWFERSVLRELGITRELEYLSRNDKNFRAQYLSLLIEPLDKELLSALVSTQATEELITEINKQVVRIIAGIIANCNFISEAFSEKDPYGILSGCNGFVLPNNLKEILKSFKQKFAIPLIHYITKQKRLLTELLYKERITLEKMEKQFGIVLENVDAMIQAAYRSRQVEFDRKKKLAESKKIPS